MIVLTPPTTLVEQHAVERLLNFPVQQVLAGVGTSFYAIQAESGPDFPRKATHFEWPRTILESFSMGPSSGHSYVDSAGKLLWVQFPYPRTSTGTGESTTYWNLAKGQYQVESRGNYYLLRRGSKLLTFKGDDLQSEHTLPAFTGTYGVSRFNGLVAAIIVRGARTSLTAYPRRGARIREVPLRTKGGQVLGDAFPEGSLEFLSQNIVVTALRLKLEEQGVSMLGEQSGFPRGTGIYLCLVKISDGSARPIVRLTSSTIGTATVVAEPLRNRIALVGNHLIWIDGDVLLRVPVQAVDWKN